MNRPQILIIEDDNAIGNLISTTLETQHYQYRRAKNGASGVLEAASCRPDVILLDLGLPDMDGVDIIKKVRTWSNTPIIVISARSEDHDKVEALDAGADDYLTKPFSVEELLARLRVSLWMPSPSRAAMGTSRYWPSRSSRGVSTAVTTCTPVRRSKVCWPRTSSLILAVSHSLSLRRVIL